jgi:pimeloyl-ACP methyl ester carboxylesterase
VSGRQSTKSRFRAGDLQVSTAGSGTRIGYLHGIVGTPDQHPFLDALSARCEIVAPALPGFSRSEPHEGLRQFYDWVVATSEIVGLTGLTGRPLVASSVGAMLALEVAAVRPEAFSELVLISPYGLWADDEPVADLFARRALDEADILTVKPASVDSFYEDDPELPDDVTVQNRVNRYVTRRSVAHLVWGVPDHGLAERLHLVNCPVTLIWGADDKLIPVSYLDRFAAALPNVVGTHIVEEAGHLVEWDRPEETAELVATALRLP